MAKYGNPGIGGLRTPLEGVDLVADGINRLATLTPDTLESMGQASNRMLGNISDDISRPREQPERPIPPDVLLKPIPSAVGHVVGGVVDIVKSGVGSVISNVDGARQELETFFRG